MASVTADHWIEEYDHLNADEFAAEHQAEYCLNRLNQRMTVARLKFIRDTEYSTSPDAYYAGVDEADKLSNDLGLPISAINVLVNCVDQFDV